MVEEEEECEEEETSRRTGLKKMRRVAEIIGRNNFVQGLVLIVIALSTSAARRLAASPSSSERPNQVFYLHLFGIIIILSYAQSLNVHVPLITTSLAWSGVLSLRSCSLCRQLTGAARAEDGHDTETAVEKNHRICYQASHRCHAS